MTDSEMLEEFKRQHLQTYKKAVEEIIKNNTKALIDEDICSLIKQPPLDSMDAVKNKLISLAKKEKLILNTEKLNSLVKKFRNDLKDDLNHLKEVRQSRLIDKVQSFEPERETEIITIQNKDLTPINRELKKQFKGMLKENISSRLEPDVETIYSESADEAAKQKVTTGFLKYMSGPYQKQLLSEIEMKTMIKDRTLISMVNEHGERYLFTKTNSHIFDSEKSTRK